MLPYWRNLDLVTLCERQGLRATATWLGAVAERPSVQQTSAGLDEMVRASKKYYVGYASPGAPGEAALA